MNANATTFLSNAENYFFEVETAIDLGSCVNCTVHDSRDAMIDYVAKLSGVDIDELTNAAIIIRSSEDGEFESCDHRGIWSTIDLDGNTIEQWLSSFVM
jgi:hypothetical protein